MGGGSFSRNGKSGKNTSVIFSLKDGVGALAEALKVFKVSNKQVCNLMGGHVLIMTLDYVRHMM